MPDATFAARSPPTAAASSKPLDRFVQNPRADDIRRLQGSTEWRLRIGNLHVRTTFDDEARVVHVARVLPRGRAYGR